MMQTESMNNASNRGWVAGRARPRSAARGALLGALRAALLGGALLGGVLSAGVLAGCGGGGGAQAGSTSHALVGAAAPPFNLPAQAGGEVATLDAAAGKVALVDFWATWCEPCRKSFPHYEELVQKHSGEVEVIGISVDDEPDGIKAFAEQTGVSFVLAWDRAKAAADAYQPPAMPTCFVVDRKGVVRHVHAGYHPGDERQIDSEIEALLAQ